MPIDYLTYPHPNEHDRAFKMIPGSRRYVMGARWDLPDTRMTRAILELFNIEAPEPQPPAVPPDVVVHQEGIDDYQIEGVARMLAEKHVLVADDTGLGKTPMTVTAMDNVHSRDPYLVVCSKSLQYNWANEIRRWSALRPVIIEGGPAQRASQIEGAVQNDVVICSYEQARMHSRIAGWGDYRNRRPGDTEPRELNRDWAAVVVDEVHNIKDPNARRTRALWAIGETAEYRWGLSATPVVNDADDLWSVMRFISPSEWPSRSRYRDLFCNVWIPPWGGVQNMGLNPHTRPALDKALLPRYLRRTKEDVLELPDKTFTTIQLQMHGQQRTAYLQMHKRMYALFGDDFLVAPDHLVQRLRLRQIACATPVTDPDDPLLVPDLRMPSNKIDFVNIWLDEHPDEQLVVFAESAKFVKLLAREIQGVGLITGDTDRQERNTLIAEFQAGRLRTLALTFAVGAEGLTLTAARYMIVAQPSDSFKDTEQAANRIHRRGQLHAVEIITLVSEGTVDLNAMRNADTKRARAEDVHAT